MKKYLYVFTFLFITPVASFAASGACSYHNGINCTLSKAVNGSVVCNDGWIESSANLSEVSMCQNTDLTGQCTREEYTHFLSMYDNYPLLIQDIADIDQQINIINSTNYTENYQKSLSSQGGFVNDNQARLELKNILTEARSKKQSLLYDKQQKYFFINQVLQKVAIQCSNLGTKYSATSQSVNDVFSFTPPQLAEAQVNEQFSIVIPFKNPEHKPLKFSYNFPPEFGFVDTSLPVSDNSVVIKVTPKVKGSFLFTVNALTGTNQDHVITLGTENISLTVLDSSDTNQSTANTSPCPANASIQKGFCSCNDGYSFISNACIKTEDASLKYTPDSVKNKKDSFIANIPNQKRDLHTSKKYESADATISATPTNLQITAATSTGTVAPVTQIKVTEIPKKKRVWFNPFTWFN